MLVPCGRLCLLIVLLAGATLFAALPAQAQDTTRLPHPHLVTPDLPWVVTVPRAEMLLYVHSGFHAPARVHVASDGMYEDTPVMSVMSSPRHVVHPFEVDTTYRRVVIEADQPMYVALVEPDRFMVSSAERLRFGCDGRSGAVLWSPPMSAAIGFLPDAGAPTVSVYARPDHYQLVADGGGVERSGDRMPMHEAYWVVHEGAGAGCNGVMRLHTVAAPVILRDPWTPWLAALVLSAAAALWLAPRLPDPPLARRPRRKRHRTKDVF